MKSEYMRRLVSLEKSDYRIIRNLALEKGLGQRGFSAALRMIVREWREMRAANANAFFVFGSGEHTDGEEGG